MRTLRVAAASSPHVCYVFGVRGSLEEIAARSVKVAVEHILLGGTVAASAKEAGDAGAPVTLVEEAARPHRPVSVAFGAAQVDACQAQVDAFKATLDGLVAQGHASFWSRAEAQGDDGSIS